MIGFVTLPTEVIYEIGEKLIANIPTLLYDWETIEKIYYDTETSGGSVPATPTPHGQTSGLTPTMGLNNLE
jgi:hypothetical protein